MVRAVAPFICGSEDSIRLGKSYLGGSRYMSDRMKLTLASLTAMMLPHRLGYSLTVLVLTAIMSTAIDLAKETFCRDAGVL